MSGVERAARVVIGLLGAQGQFARRGIGRYACAYASALCARAPEQVVRVELPDPELPPPLLNTGRCDVGVLSDTGARPRLPGPLIYHALAPFVPLQDRSEGLAPLSFAWPRWARAPDVALVVTVYDLIPLRYPEQYLSRPRVRAEYDTRLGLVRTADAVLAISSAARDDLIELGGVDPARVHVVGAASPLVSDMPPTHTPPAVDSNPEGAPIVFVTGDDPRKNTTRLVEAYTRLPRALRRSHRLVVVGALSTVTKARLRAAARRGGAMRDVVLTGELSDEALVRLYSSAGLVVFPSFAEGFGLPMLEGLSLGAMVVASDIPSARELIPDPAARFDPASTEAMRNTIERGLTDPELRTRVRGATRESIAQFTWQQVVARSLDAYAAAAAQRAPADAEKTRRRRGDPRLAIITPLAPARTGVAAYSERLIDAMRQRAPVDVYADQSWRLAPEGASNHPRQPLAGTRGAHHLPWVQEFSNPELVSLMVLGGSPYHGDAWRLLMRLGGDVLLHDLFLVGLYDHLARCGQLYGSDLRARELELRRSTADEQYARGALMFTDVVDRARRVYVHSAAARELILRQRPTRASSVYVVPFGHPALNPAVPNPAQPVIASFGYLKHPKRVIEASLPVLRAVPEARLWLVGDAPVRGQLAALRRLASDFDVGGRIEITGWVNDNEYLRRLRATTVAVQLRSRFYGESSAATADLLASGVPTIVNDVGWLGELPGDTMLRLGPWPTTDEIADALMALFNDPAKRARLRAGALRFAAENSMDRAAGQLIDLMASAS